MERKLKSLRIIAALVKQLSFFKVPEVQASVRIIFEQAITKGKSSDSRIFKSSQGQMITHAIRLLKMRRYHFPIQYLVGEWYFRQLKLKLSPPILIPRFQTQFLISQALQAIRKKWKNGSVIKFIDLGCGSGAIGLSLLKQLSDDYQVEGILLDKNPKCIDLSKQNALKNILDLSKLSFVCEDMRKCSNLIEQCNIVISNPPYLNQKSHKKLQKQVKLYEDHSALVGGQDGLDFVRFLLKQMKRLKEVRQDVMCFIEYGGENLQQMDAQQYVRLDQYGRRRFLMIQ